jgi:hypothetical protein
MRVRACACVCGWVVAVRKGRGCVRRRQGGPPDGCALQVDGEAEALSGLVRFSLVFAVGRIGRPVVVSPSLDCRRRRGGGGDGGVSLSSCCRHYHGGSTGGPVPAALMPLLFRFPQHLLLLLLMATTGASTISAQRASRAFSPRRLRQTGTTPRTAATPCSTWCAAQSVATAADYYYDAAGAGSAAVAADAGTVALLAPMVLLLPMLLLPMLLLLLLAAATATGIVDEWPCLGGMDRREPSSHAWVGPLRRPLASSPPSVPPP